MADEIKQHTISVLVENKFGALARIAGLFSGRGYNIESLTVNHTHDPNLSRMTIVTKGTDEVLEQIEKQLNKLVDVVNVTDLNSSDYLELELAIIKVRTSALTRVAIVQLVELFHGYIPNVNKDELCIAISGSPQKIEHFLTLMSDFKIIEIARTGSTAVTRDSGVTRSKK
ncbi:MAG: acetolactate synthase small subunit [Lentisphaeria bacterium]|nr:acetolactate synthase small subunit [Lentisphaeria bacterium]MBR4664866.1 acetolactate synthase small subunit [Lentisphaeria bacterium]